MRRLNLATQNDPDFLHAAIETLLKSLASIEGQQARLDDELDELAKRNEIAWRLMAGVRRRPNNGSGLYGGDRERRAVSQDTRHRRIPGAWRSDDISRQKQMGAWAFPSRATPWRGTIYMKPPMCF